MLDLFNNKEQENENDPYKDIAKNAKTYAELQLQLLKLNLTSALSQIISYLIIIIAGSLLLMTAFVYFSMILVVWLKDATGSWIYGFLIIGVFFVLLFLIFWLLRKKLFLNPIIRKMSSILFNNEAQLLEEDEFTENNKVEESCKTEKEVDDEE